MIRLDSFAGMTDALRLYRALGFRPRAPHPTGGPPPELLRDWLFMERETGPR